MVCSSTIDLKPTTESDVIAGGVFCVSPDELVDVAMLRLRHGFGTSTGFTALIITAQISRGHVLFLTTGHRPPTTTTTAVTRAPSETVAACLSPVGW
jgi:hypothetical protein